MADLTLRDQIVQHLRRAILHLIDVNTRIEQKPLPANRDHIDERKLIDAPPGQRPVRVEPRLADESVACHR
ncbi:MAG TPA: hypothetical protein VGG49_11820 [Steroidobacteraceae bacterium]|jgi:hypothetical protein